MRTLFLSLLCLFGALTILQAQDSSYGIAYQAVARDADGDPLADTELAVRVTLKDGATTVWQEEHASVLTNQFGNLALTIGSGVTSAGTSLADVDWSAAGLHFEIEVDPGTGTYASFGDVAVQAVPVAMYALNGQEEEIAALWTALADHEGDFNSFVTATNSSLSDLQGQIDANASQGAALLGMIQDAQGDISLLQIAVDQNTADLADIFANMTINPDGSMTFNDIYVNDMVVNGSLDIPGVFSAATGLFNYLSAGNADFEEVLIESLVAEDLTFYTAHGVGPASSLDLDGSLNVDGAATFNGSVTAPAPVAANNVTTKAYVDAADNILQSNIDAEVTRATGAEAALAQDLAAEVSRATAAEEAEEERAMAAEAALAQDLAAEVSRATAAEEAEEERAMAAEAALAQDLANEVSRATGAEAALAQDIADEVSRATGAEAALAQDIADEQARAEGAEADLQGQIDDNGFRIGSAAAASGFTSGDVNGVSGVPTHPGYSGTNNLDNETNLVAADIALDNAIQAEVVRATAAEGDLQGQISANDGDIATLTTDLAAEVTRATGREDQIEADAAAARGVIAANLATEIARATGVEAGLAQDIADETSRATGVEAGLAQDIANEQARAEGAEAALLQAIQTEEASRITAVNNLQGAIDAEVTRATGVEAGLAQDIANEQARAEGVEADLQSQITSNDGDILNLQMSLANEVAARQFGDAMNANAIGQNTVAISTESSTRAAADAALAAEDQELWDAINGIPGSIYDVESIVEGMDYWDNTGNTVTLESPYNAMNVGTINASTSNFNSTSAQTGDIDALTTQNLEVTDDLYAPMGTIDDLDATHMQVWDDLNVEGLSSLSNTDVDGNLDVTGTLNVDGETTLGDNTSIDGNLTVTGSGSFGGTVTAADATELTHLASFGQLTTAADTLQENIDDEIARATARENQIQAELDNTQAGAGLAADGSYNANTGTSYIDAATSLDSADDLLDAALKAEETRALAAEGVLQANINAEAAARIAADITISDSLQANINDEVARALAAEGVLQTNIDNEVTRATTAEGLLQDNIDAEELRATTAEGLLQDNIDAEEAARIAADITISDSLQANINDEVVRALAAEALLQDNIDAEEAARIAADITISDSLQANIDDEVLRATTRENELQSELDATQTGAGLAANGSYNANSGTSYIDAATSLDNADDILDAALKAEETRAITREDSIISVLYWNLGPGGFNPSENELTLDPGIDNIDLDDTDMDVDVLTANSVGAQNANFENMWVDEAEFNNLQADDIVSGGIVTQTIRWTHALAWGSASTTDLEGTLNVDGATTLNSTLDVDGQADFHDDVNIDLDLDVDGYTTLDSTVINERLEFDGTEVIVNADTVGMFAYDGIGFYQGDGSKIELTWEDGQFNYLNGSSNDELINIESYYDVNITADGTAGIELGYDEDAMVLYADSIRFEEGDVHVANNLNVEDNLDVDGITTVDSLNASLGVDFGSTLNVDGATTLNSTLDVDGDADFHSDVVIDGDLSVDDVTGDSLDFNYAEIDRLAIDTLYNLTGAGLVMEVTDADFTVNTNEDIYLNADGSIDLSVDGDGNSYYPELLLEFDGGVSQSTLWADEVFVNADSVYVNADSISLDADDEMTLRAWNDIEIYSESNDVSIWADSDVDIDGYDDVRVYANDEITLRQLDESYIALTWDYGQFDYLDGSNDNMISIYSDADVNITAAYVAGLELSYDERAALLYGDSVLIDGRFVARDGAEFYSTMEVDGQADFNDDVNIDFDLDVDGVTTVDSLNASLGVYFQSTLEVDGTSLFNDDMVIDADLSVDDVTGDSLDFNYGEIDRLAIDTLYNLTGAGLVMEVTDADFTVNTNEDIYLNADGSIDLSVDGDGNSYYPELLLEFDGGVSQSTLWADEVFVNADSVYVNADSISLDADDEMTLRAWNDIDMYSEDGDVNIWADSDVDIDGYDDVWVYANDEIELNQNDDSYIELTWDYDQFNYLVGSDGNMINIFSDEDVNITAYDVAGLELSYDERAALLYGDSVLIDGRFVARDGAEFYSTMEVDGQADFNDDVNIDLDLDVDGVTTVDSLNASLGVYFQSTLEVDGTSQFNDDVNVDATLTADTAVVEYHLVVETPAYPGASATILDEPEFAVKNLSGDYIVAVDGHNSMMTVQNLTVTDNATWSGDMEVYGDITGDNISSTSTMTAGGSNYGVNWPTDGIDNNVLTRRDYVDFHRINQTNVPQFWSYDADLIAGSNGADYNESVYYMNGNVVLYEDSVSTAPSVAGDNYVFTVVGTNFNQFRDSDGSLVGNYDILGELWAENNSIDVNITRVDANTLTFTLGYADVNAIVACTDGVVRPKLAVGTADGGMFDTGIYLFLDIVAATVIE